MEYENAVGHLEGQIVELEQAGVEAGGQHQFTLMSPVTGKVSAVYIHEGSDVTPAKPTFALLPSPSELVAELFVSSKSIAFVQEGQSVALSYEAFPNQQFGTFEATIYQISRTAFLPEENMTGLTFSEPVYRVLAKIDSNEIEIGNGSVPLQSGMRFRAAIMLEKSSLIDMVLLPIRKLRAGI